MKKPLFENGEVYHVYNRGVEKRNIFLDDYDYFRFTYGLYDFNDKNSAYNYRYKSSTLQVHEVRLREREIVVDILAFCLMDNHFHLLMRQILENGVVQLMQKLGTGYTNFFNTKYERVGPLFQGSFKAVAIKKESHLLYLPYYIHANPLDLEVPGWRENGVLDHKKAMQFLKQYRYSSHTDYMGGGNHAAILEKQSLRDFLGTPTEYEKTMVDWLKSRGSSEMDELTLE